MEEEDNTYQENHGCLLKAARKVSVLVTKMVELPMKIRAPVRASIILFLILLTAALLSLHWIDAVPPAITDMSFQEAFLPSITSNTSWVGINCSFTCPTPSPATIKPNESSSSEVCPEYFRWIHEDLKPWKKKGITKKMVESIQSEAHIRIIVVNGRLYVRKYRGVYQTRDVFTVWGILQLMKLYPGKLPDLDIMFECSDRPVIQKRNYGGSKVPPMFHYCGSDSTLDIAFPDWSFWGWPEVYIKPWETLRKDLEEGNKRVKWIDRLPYAYWKGNSWVSSVRNELLKCNVTDKQDWGALVYQLDWELAREERYKNTNLANQCTHRYKIYAEGVAWSVSQKYILACDSMSLLIAPHFYEFFTRSLLPTIHYLPINEMDMCRSIKFAVDWGNKYPQKAQEIGKVGSKFILDELKMKNVYDYMFHLLYGYGKLLKYKPIVPKGSTEVCLETLACSGSELEKKFKMISMVSGPRDTSPCTMPAAYDPTTLQSFLERKANLTKQVERWEASEHT
ncbi:hypothetical protein CsSME_00023934 [Camellia sinensis var. sinensis]